MNGKYENTKEKKLRVADLYDQRIIKPHDN
jgi:hypothetical protein